MVLTMCCFPLKHSIFLLILESNLKEENSLIPKKKKKKIHEGWRDQDGKGKAHYLTGWSPGAGDRWFRQEVGQRKEGMQKGEVQTGA